MLVVRAVEQIVFVRASRRQSLQPPLVDMDVAGRAGAAAAAQGEEFVEAVVADDLHHAVARARFDGGFGSVAVDDDELGHKRNRP